MKPDKNKKDKKLQPKNAFPDTWWLWAGIPVLVTLIAFSPLFNADFTDWDDPAYILSNPYITAISFRNSKHMFSSFLLGNYQPISFFSTAVEYYFAGYSPEVFHGTNVILHLLNTFLVFRFIQLLSGNLYVAFITSMLFGIHPMHVESVGWISERKDVLYTFFFFASLIYYLLYLQNNFNRKYFLISIFLFLLSLMSKGQAVVLSVILVLIDFLKQRNLRDRKVINEKIPFFLLSLLFGIIAYFAQKSLGALNEEHLTAAKSFFFGWYGLLLYILKAFIPYGLCAFYPYLLDHDGSVPYIVFTAIPLLAILAFLCWKYLKQNRAAVFGILFFLFAIFPLLQFLPVGKQMLAERYTYIPYVGIFFMIGNFYQFIINSRSGWANALRPYINYILGAWCIILFISARNGCKVWHDTISLWSDVIKKYPKSKLAYRNRFIGYNAIHQTDNAIQDCTTRILNDSTDAVAWDNRGFMYYNRKEYARGLADLNKAASLDSTNTEIYYNRGLCYFNLKMLPEAVRDYKLAIRCDSNTEDAYNNLGMIYTDYLQKYDEGIAIFKLGLKADSLNANSWTNLGVVLDKKGNYPDALNALNNAVRLSPDNGLAYYVRAQVYIHLNNLNAAYRDVLKAKELGQQVDENVLRQLQAAIGKNA